MTDALLTVVCSLVLWLALISLAAHLWRVEQRRRAEQALLDEADLMCDELEVTDEA